MVFNNKILFLILFLSDGENKLLSYTIPGLSMNKQTGLLVVSICDYSIDTRLRGKSPLGNLKGFLAFISFPSKDDTQRGQVTGATTLSIMTLSIMTLSIKGLYVTHSIIDTHHNNAVT